MGPGGVGLAEHCKMGSKAAYLTEQERIDMQTMEIKVLSFEEAGPGDR